MSATGPSDPRLLLPEWLRDGDMPAAAQTASDVIAPSTVAVAPRSVDIVDVEAITVPVAAAPSTPFSDRLSLDTRLDPGQLVSAADLPSWLGGHDRVTSSTATPLAASTGTKSASAAAPIEEPEPYLGVDAPADRAIDVEVSGWMLVAGAIGLLILVLAAIWLYSS